MAVSKIKIINIACRRIGEQGITSLDEDSNVADVMNDIYDHCLDAELRDWPYPFATVTTELAALSSEEPPDFGYAFQLPADYLDMVEIVDPATGIQHYSYDYRYGRAKYSEVTQWERREDKLYMNLDEVTIKYIKLEVDPVKWDASFRDMFAWRLADEMAMPITERADVAQRTTQRYLTALLKARGSAGAESRRTSDVSRNYIRARI